MTFHFLFNRPGLPKFPVWAPKGFLGKQTQVMRPALSTVSHQQWEETNFSN